MVGACEEWYNEEIGTDVSTWKEHKTLFPEYQKRGHEMALVMGRQPKLSATIVNSGATRVIIALHIRGFGALVTNMFRLHQRSHVSRLNQ